MHCQSDYCWPQTGVTNQRRYVIYRSVSFALLKVIKYDIRLGEFARCADVGKAMQCTHTRIGCMGVCIAFSASSGIDKHREKTRPHHSAFFRRRNRILCALAMIYLHALPYFVSSRCFCPPGAHARGKNALFPI